MFRSDHVSGLVWLLDLRPGVWRDREKTFCDKIESDSRRFVSYVHSHQQALNLKRKPYLLHKVCTVLYCTALYCTCCTSSSPSPGASPASVPSSASATSPGAPGTGTGTRWIYCD